MMERRTFLSGLAAAAAIPWLSSATANAHFSDHFLRDNLLLEPDETFWAQVRQAYAVDKTIINLENGGVNPSPIPVIESIKTYLDLSHKAPVYTMNRIMAPQIERVRSQLADAFGCDSEEIAITRNTTEAMEILQLGLDLKPGDEIITTTQDYWRFINTWKQREVRDGVVLNTVQIPVPCEDDDEILEIFRSAITDRTKVIMVCHVVNLSGQILPIRKLQDLADAHNIDLLVDGAHGFGQFAFKRGDLGCHFYTCSLHKWLGAPHGTGFLYVEKTSIPRIWPMFPASEAMRNDIRKFENIGTFPVGNYLAISDALSFYSGLGPQRKEARLRYLVQQIKTGLTTIPGLRLLSSDDPKYACALAVFHLEGVRHEELADHLWEKNRILVRAIRHSEYTGIRVTPNVYTTLHEIDEFVEAVKSYASR